MKTIKSKDGTIKFKFDEGYSAVLIPMNTKTKDGEERIGTYTLCLSSQVGCAMNCQFCHSAKTRFKRNLTVEELKEQINTAFVYLQPKTYNLKPKTIEKLPLNSIVFMGMGEPLLNLKNILEFCKYLNEEYYLSYQKMTISTSGIIPKMKEVLNTNLKIKLALSLHSPDQKIRDKIMPGLKQYPVKDLVEFCHTYNKKYKQKIMIEYLMIKGLTDREEDLQKLIDFKFDKYTYFNLIPLNSEFRLEDKTYISSDKGTMEHWKTKLRKVEYKCFIRESMGEDIEAACGMLK